jgi:N-acyl homoserine lactone hydrolase
MLLPEEASCFIAGDTSYTERILLQGKVDGVSPDIRIAQRTLSRIMALALQQPLVYLPSHDPDSLLRLQQESVIKSDKDGGRIPIARKTSAP